MECKWTVKTSIPSKKDEEKIKKLVCSKIASLIIYQEEKKCTFERVSKIY